MYCKGYTYYKKVYPTNKKDFLTKLEMRLKTLQYTISRISQTFLQRLHYRLKTNDYNPGLS
jgi:hypothetical protein